MAGIVAIEFDFATTADCRVAGIPWLYVLNASNERASFLNQLQSFNYALWGCTSSPPTQFALIYEEGLVEDPRPITSADTAALIEDYLAIVEPRLSLSQGEVDAVRTMLSDLATNVIAVESSEYSRGECSDGEGGAGGEASTGGEGGTGGS